ncbi:MAG: hypothetical protein D6E12_03005 [Desulfovibrio sp.]|nr:MAG: hypothetical protein D6E12_03005 [Desulfovibrio sp.]
MPANTTQPAIPLRMAAASLSRALHNKPYACIVAPGPDGRIRAKLETIGDRQLLTEYEYDEAGRLTRVQRNGEETERYTYDAQGRRSNESNTLRKLPVRPFHYTDDNQLLSAGFTRFAYDENNRLKRRTFGQNHTHYDYDHKGRLNCVRFPGNIWLLFGHDSKGRRTYKQYADNRVEKYGYDRQGRLGYSYDAEKPASYFFFYGDHPRLPQTMRDSQDSEYDLYYDHLGSLRAVVDSQGHIVKEIDYDSFGNIIQETNPDMRLPLGFAGGLHDRQTGLVSFTHRDYMPDVGRFTAQDPIGHLGGEDDLYGYCLDDPINRIDPSGLFPEVPFAPQGGNIWPLLHENAPEPVQETMEFMAEHDEQQRENDALARQAEQEQRALEGPPTVLTDDQLLEYRDNPNYLMQQDENVRQAFGEQIAPAEESGSIPLASDPLDELDQALWNDSLSPEPERPETPPAEPIAPEPPLVLTDEQLQQFRDNPGLLMLQDDEVRQAFGEQVAAAEESGRVPLEADLLDEQDQALWQDSLSPEFDVKMKSNQRLSTTEKFFRALLGATTIVPLYVLERLVEDMGVTVALSLFPALTPANAALIALSGGAESGLTIWDQIGTNYESFPSDGERLNRYLPNGDVLGYISTIPHNIDIPFYGRLIEQGEEDE